MTPDKYRGRYFATLDKLTNLEALAEDMADLLGLMISAPNIELTPSQEKKIRDILCDYENRPE
jgi:hypothetical protein